MPLNFHKSDGFTLIELLVVIAILGIIIAAVVVGINPVDKINAANDAKVQSDIGAIGTAYEANATSNGTGTYAANIAALVTSGDLKVAPSAPSGYTAYSTGAGGATARVSGQLKSLKYSATPFWIWCSSNGKVCATTTATTCCP